jgi:hypothetical protein
MLSIRLKCGDFFEWIHGQDARMRIGEASDLPDDVLAGEGKPSIRLTYGDFFEWIDGTNALAKCKDEDWGGPRLA